MSVLNITIIPGLVDNYFWLIQEDKSNQAIIVDPGDAKPVLQKIKQLNADPVAMFITHHHWDHVTGIKDVLQEYPNLPVYGPGTENIFGITHAVSENEIIKLAGWQTEFKIIALPGHTLGHVAYYTDGHLFSGDTLFAVGCGYLFEGTAEQMHNSLSKLAALPDETQVYCAHEYTLSNIAFAKQVEPENAALLAREQEVSNLQTQSMPSIPTRIGLEKTTNPFMRVLNTTVKSAAESYSGRTLDSPAEVFAVIREWKNEWQ